MRRARLDKGADPLDERVWRCLKREGTAGPSLIARSIGANVSSVGAALARLRDAGRARRVGDSSRGPWEAL